MKDLLFIISKIESLYFNILKNVQHIERNLAKVIACKELLDNKDKTNISKRLLKKGDEVYNSLMKKTLGEIIASAMDYKVFKRKNDYIILQNLLEYRNYLVHEFFKENNIDKEISDKNIQILNTIMLKLKEEYEKSYEINVYLINTFNEIREDILMFLRNK